MPVQLEKWIASPLEVVSSLHAERGGGEDWGIVEHFTELLKSGDNLAKVPSLNSTPLEHIPDGCLVRYRAMVQDQFDPELYLKEYYAVHPASGHQLKCCGMYRDLTAHPPDYDINYDHPENVTRDRQTLYCVPIPAETEWARAVYDEQGCVGSPVDEEATEQKPRAKRQLQDCGEGEEEEEGVMEVEGEGEGGGVGKRPREQSGTGEPMTHAAQSTRPDLNFPLPGETGLPCLVKVYDDVEALKVTSMVECVGVLSKHPHLAHFESGGEDGGEGGLVEPFSGETAAERAAHSPPPSLIPRLHCILVRPLAHSHPLLPRDLPFPLPKEVYPSQFGGVAKTRDLALSLLTSSLLGDRLAAEYTLLHLLSSIYGRTDMIVLGKFSFNLTNFRSSSPSPLPLTPSLHTLLSHLLPKSVLLPLSLSVMNSWQFSPRKDYSANRLIAGALQLSAGTHLLVDETALEPGHLSEVGVQNLAAVSQVIREQTVSYDFQYHKTDFDCDLPVMVLTEGKKSILNLDCTLPLCPSPSPPLPAPPTEEQLNEARIYLGLNRMLNYQLPSNIRKLVEEDFVTMRKTDQGMTADRFHYLLSLARLVSLSYGCHELTLLHWQHTKQLEKERLERLSKQ